MMDLQRRLKSFWKLAQRLHHAEKRWQSQQATDVLQQRDQSE